MNQEPKSLTVRNLPAARSSGLVFSGGLVTAGVAVAAIAGQWVFGGLLAVVGMVWGVVLVLKRIERSADVPEDPVQSQINGIKLKLNKVLMADGFEDGAQSLLDQLSALKKKVDVFRRLIDSKLNSGEMTRKRFEDATYSVFFLVLENLEQAADLFSTIMTGGSSEIRESQLGKIAGLKNANDRALEEIDKMNVGLTEMKSGAADLELALKELELLAQRAKLYTATRNPQ